MAQRSVDIMSAGNARTQVDGQAVVPRSAGVPWRVSSAVGRIGMEGRVAQGYCGIRRELSKDLRHRRESGGFGSVGTEAIVFPTRPLGQAESGGFRSRMSLEDSDQAESGGLRSRKSQEDSEQGNRWESGGFLSMSTESWGRGPPG